MLRKSLFGEIKKFNLKSTAAGDPVNGDELDTQLCEIIKVLFAVSIAHDSNSFY